jgi:Concanavalin A-like lectin/glucanases superfamily
MWSRSVPRTPRQARLAWQLAWGLALASGCTSHNPLYSRATSTGDAGGGGGEVQPGPANDAATSVDASGDARTAHETIAAEDDAGVDAADALPPSPPDLAPVVEVAPEAPAAEVFPPDAAPPEVAPPDVPAPMVASLVGYWKLDEKSGTVAADSSGNRLDGVLENFPAAGLWVSTPRGGGLSFPVGATSAGVRVGKLNEVSPLITGLARFTLAAWTFRTPTTTQKHTSVISRQSQTVEDKDVFNLTFDGPRLRLYVFPDPPTGTIFAEGPLTAGVGGGEWVHVAATFDGRLIRLYVNGVQTGTPLSYERSLHMSNSPLYLGTNKNPRSVDQPFEGILDEIMLFSEALDAAAIAKVRDGVLTP